MNILALDTATEHTSICLYLNGAYHSLSEHSGVKSSAYILPMIAKLMKGHSWDSLDVLAYGQGPGTFTGVRVGISVVQALALANMLPTIGFSSLHILEYGAQQTFQTSAIISTIDARMGEVYLRYNDTEFLIRPEDINAILPVDRSDYIGVGTGFATYDNFAHCKEYYPEQYPRAKYLVSLALASKQWSYALATPCYLRNNIAKKSVKL